MAQLKNAIERLDAAIGRLERAAAQRRPPQSEGDPALQAQLTDTRNHNAVLQQAVDEASTRLDSAIERLNSMLEA